MEESTSGKSRNSPSSLQQVSKHAQGAEGSGRGQQAMGLRSEASSLPPLIDFGDENDIISPLTHAGPLSYMFSEFESPPNNWGPVSINGVSSLSSLSPAESSSSPLPSKQWEVSQLGASSQRLIFDRPDLMLNGIGNLMLNGDVIGNLSSSPSSKATVSNSGRNIYSNKSLSENFVSSSAASNTSQASSVSSPQIDLLSSDGAFFPDPALSTPPTPCSSLHSSKGLNSLSPQTPLCDILPLQGLNSVSPQSLLTSTPSSKDMHSVSSEWRSPFDNPFDYSFQSPFFVPPAGIASIEDAFASLSVAAGNLQSHSGASLQTGGEQISEEMLALPHQNKTDRKMDGLGLLEHMVSSIDSCESSVPDSLRFKADDRGENFLVDEIEAASRITCGSYDDNNWQQLGSDCPRIMYSDAGQDDGRASLEQSSTGVKESLSTMAGRSEDFVGAGGGKGIFKAPVRGAVYPNRPVPLELRPQPLKETLINQPTRVLLCTDTAVWSGCDLGIMVWDIQSACGLNCSGRENMTGDEDAAAYNLLHAQGFAPTCLFPDTANNIVWSGHKDGRIRAWNMLFSHGNEMECNGNAAILTWQAHQSPVLAIVVTSYGELWTGSENGSLRAWPWDAIADALSNSEDPIHTAASPVATSYIDLKSRGAAAGASSLPNMDVGFLMAEHSTCRVWSGGSYLLALWDARTRDILKVFGPNADPEFSSPNISPVRETVRAEEVKLNFVKVPKKEKIQGTLSFFQRSRNAVMGAADAVLRAAVGGQSMDDSKKMEALVATADGKVWVGYANGSLVQWDSCGNRLIEVRHSLIAVRCLCTFGSRIFAGYADGIVQVLALESGKLLGAWSAHSSAVAKMGVGGHHLFTLADHGGIRGCFITSPSPFDAAFYSRMVSKEASYIRHENIKVFAGTWNVGQEKASFESLNLWLKRLSTEASIVVVGLQELEMGAGALAMAAAKETVGLAGSVNGQWWLESIGGALNEGKVFERVASRQLAGLLIGAWVKKEILPYVGGVDVAAVACGFGRAFGNKGAVAVKMMVFRRTVCVVNCHFAAHMDAVVKRNADFEHIYLKMAFGRSFGGVGVAATAMAASAVQIIRGNNSRQDTSSFDVQDFYSEKASSSSIMEDQSEDMVVMPELSEADLLIWIGDFNYRLDDLSYVDAVNLIAHKRWDELLKKDQLRSEMKAGRVFQGMREADISFPPTYKFDKGFNGSGTFNLGYDSTEKRRVPAWCDRILFRDSFDRNDLVRKPGLSHPISATATWYAACMDAVESDHKPVSCLFNVEIAVVNEAAFRWEYGRLMYNNGEVLPIQKQIDTVPETVVNTNNLKLADWNVSHLKISNECGRNWAVFSIYCEGEPIGSSCPCKQNHNIENKKKSCKGCYGFPIWLQVLPASGVLQPGQTVEIGIQYVGRELLTEHDTSCRQQTWWDDREQGKAIVLVVEVKGVLSCCSRQHRVCVSHFSSSHDVPHSGDPHNHSQRAFLNRSEFLASNINAHSSFF